MRLKLPAAKILDWDIENRPLSYLGQDYTTAEVTAIAASFGPKKKMHCWLLGKDSLLDILENFRELYDQADIVTGHYIRAHDLPVVNGALIELGRPGLAPKLVSDTKLDCIKTKYMSMSQESLGAMLGLAAPKYHMTQADWRAANRLQQIKLTRKRVTADVIQHMELRQVLLEMGVLGPPRIWYPRRH